MSEKSLGDAPRRCCSVREGVGNRTGDEVVLVRSGDPATQLDFTSAPLGGGATALFPTAPLIEREHYTLVDANQCNGRSGPSVEFDVIAAAPLPTMLGTLTSQPGFVAERTVGTSSGACTASVSAVQVHTNLALAPGAVPWASLLHYETLVDGQQWAELDGAPRAGDVFHVCTTDDSGANRGLSLGAHTLRVRATLPGTDVALLSEPTTVTLDCSTELPEPFVFHEGDGGGCNAGGSGSLVGLGLGLAALRVRRRR